MSFVAFDVVFTSKGRVLLCDKKGNTWTDRRHVARCPVMRTDAVNGIRSDAYSSRSRVLRPGEINNEQEITRGLERKLCVDHLTSGNITCDCGVRGVMPRRLLTEWLPQPWPSSARPYSYDRSMTALVQVRHYGTVLVGDYGWRSSKAQMEHIWLLDNRDWTPIIRTDVRGLPIYINDASPIFMRYGTDGAEATDARKLTVASIGRHLSRTYAPAGITIVDDGPTLIDKLDEMYPDPLTSTDRVTSPIERAILAGSFNDLLLGNLAPTTPTLMLAVPPIARHKPHANPCDQCCDHSALTQIIRSWLVSEMTPESLDEPPSICPECNAETFASITLDASGADFILTYREVN